LAVDASASNAAAGATTFVDALNVAENLAVSMYGAANITGLLTLNVGANSSTFPTGRGTAGQVLQTNGAGALTWATAGGSDPLTIKGTNTNTPSTTNTAMTFFTGRTSAGALNTNQTVADIAFENGVAAGGFKHYITTTHNAVASSNLNSMRFYMNDSATAAGSSTPGTGNKKVFEINALGTSVLGKQFIGTIADPGTLVGSTNGALQLYGTTANAAGAHLQATTSQDIYPTYQLYNSAHGNIQQCFDCYIHSDGTSKLSTTASAYKLAKATNDLVFSVDSATGNVAAGASTFANVLTLLDSGVVRVGPTATYYDLPVTRGANGQFLKTDGAGAATWATASGTGDVVGPASSVSGQLPFFSSTSGKLLSNAKVLYSISANSWSDSYELSLQPPPAGGAKEYSNTAIRLGNSAALTTSEHSTTDMDRVESRLELNYSDNNANSPNINTTGSVKLVSSGSVDISGDNASLSLERTFPGTRGNTLRGTNKITLNAPSISSEFDNLAYSLTFPYAAPASKQILQSDASGNLSWINTPSGGSGGGDVVGPASAVNSSFPIYSGTTGKILTTSFFRKVNVNEYQFFADGVNAPRIIVNNQAGTNFGILGYSRLMLGNTGTAYEGIGINSPTAGITSSYELYLPPAGPAANQILQSDASGNLSWKDNPAASGFQELPALNIDWDSATSFYKSISANTTFTFSNQSDGDMVVLTVYNSSAGVLTTTFPAAKWINGVADNVVSPLSYSVYTIMRVKGVNIILSVVNIK